VKPIGMSLAAWRWLIVACVAFSTCTAVYELVAPRVDFADGVLSPVGRWFAVPGEPTATYRVVSETPRSNLAAAGIVPGDTLVPADSFRFRWMLTPGERVLLTVVHDGRARTATVASSSRPLASDRLGWLIRIGRATAQLSMLLLALVVVWQLPDALWMRALCAFLVLFGFTPWQVDPLEYTGWLRLGSVIVEDTTIQAGICAAMIFAATIPTWPSRGFRLWMLRLCPAAFLLLEAGIAGMLFDLRPVYVTLPFRLVQACCIVATIAALSAAAAQATGQERQRLRYFAWTFALGFSGFFVSVIALWIGGNSWGSNNQAWSLPRLTLLAIPIGFAYGLLSHRVVSSNFIASRTLLYGALTSSLVPLFAVAEWTATNLFSTNQGKSAFIVALTVMVTASFKTIHKRADDLFDTWIFRKRHAAEKALGKFTKEAALIHDAPTLAARSMDALDEHIGAVATGLYIHAESETLSDRNANADYLLVASAGERPPERFGELDPLVLSLKAERADVESDALGKGGHAFPMITRGHLIGFLAIGPKRDGEILAPDEIDRVCDLARAVGLAFETIRVNDLEGRLIIAETGRAELQRLLTDLVRAPGPPGAGLEQANPNESA